MGVIFFMKNLAGLHHNNWPKSISLTKKNGFNNPRTFSLDMEENMKTYKQQKFIPRIGSQTKIFNLFFLLRRDFPKTHNCCIKN